MRCRKGSSAPVALILVCLLAVVACAPQDTGVPKPYTETVGAAGGTIADPGGCALTIPAGALSVDTAITVTTYQDTVDFGTEFPVLPGALFGVKLEPPGLALAEEATLQIPPTMTLSEGDEYPVFWYDTESEKWVETGHAQVIPGASCVETTISHFSTYGIFDKPYDVLDDFGEFVAEKGGDYAEGLLGDMYGEMYIGEEESFVGPDQYYNGCCYMRTGVEMKIQYTFNGNQHTGYWTEGSTSETSSYVLSYSYSSDALTYAVDLTVYLSCDQGESNVWISAADRSLKPGESTEVYATFLCGENQTPIADRIFTFLLSGPGRLSPLRAVTDATGEAKIEYSAADEGTAVITAELEGCACGAQLDLNPLEVTIVVSEEPEQLETWQGTLTMSQSGRSQAIGWGMVFASVEASIVVDFTMTTAASDSVACWRVDSGSGIGVTSVTITGESGDFPTEGAHGFGHRETLTLESIDIPSELSFDQISGGRGWIQFLPAGGTAGGYTMHILDIFYQPHASDQTYLDIPLTYLFAPCAISGDVALQEGTQSGSEGFLVTTEEDVPLRWTLELHQVSP